MFYAVIHWIVSALAVLVTSKLMPGFRVSNFTAALWAAAFIGLANIIIWPVLIFLTLPINILTLGLFTFVVNGAVLKICAGLLKGFDIDGWWSAIFGSIILTVLNSILHYFLV
jgi:putative membrane protein